jgi:membrane protein YqaA with SNARE-associated domain
VAEFFGNAGLPGLFLLSFLASTILPVGSEWLLVALVVNGEEALLPVGVATVGNTLGACTTYLLGVFGGPFLIGRVLRVDAEARARAAGFYARFGSWSLLLSWLPVVGDPLCLAGGLLRVPFYRFLLLVAAGKAARYAAVAFLAGEGARLLA